MPNPLVEVRPSLGRRRRYFTPNAAKFGPMLAKLGPVSNNKHSIAVKAGPNRITFGQIGATFCRARFGCRSIWLTPERSRFLAAIIGRRPQLPLVSGACFRRALEDRFIRWSPLQVVLPNGGAPALDEESPPPPVTLGSVFDLADSGQLRTDVGRYRHALTDLDPNLGRLWPTLGRL